MAANPASRANFARNARAFMERFGFDGLDMDWVSLKIFRYKAKDYI